MSPRQIAEWDKTFRAWGSPIPPRYGSSVDGRVLDNWDGVDEGLR